MNIPDITSRGDIKTLPKWAQQYIRALTVRTEALTKEIEGIGKRDTGISWWTASHGNVGIPARAKIEFNVNGTDISVNLREGLLHINAEGGNLKVYPRAANDLGIGVEDR